jgi:uncharacterized membrane protein YkvA (DUF1232 family)
MDWWEYGLIAALVAVVVLGIAAFVVWRTASGRTKVLAERLQRLPWRSRFVLAGRLFGDERVPIGVRAIPVLLVLYLAMPVDIVPDFVPVLGQLDDVAVVIVAVGLFARFVPLSVIDEHIEAIEREVRLGR